MLFVKDINRINNPAKKIYKNYITILGFTIVAIVFVYGIKLLMLLVYIVMFIAVIIALILRFLYFICY